MKGLLGKLCVSNPQAPGPTKAQLSPKQVKGQTSSEVLRDLGARREAEEMLEYLSS